MHCLTIESRKNGFENFTKRMCCSQNLIFAKKYFETFTKSSTIQGIKIFKALFKVNTTKCKYLVILTSISI